MDVEIRYVRAFLAVAEEGSYTRAARRLRVGQSSLTRAVASIESAMGIKLLDRTTRKVELTGDGRRLKADLQRWLDDLDEILAGNDRPGRLRLGFSWVLPDIWTDYAVRAFEADTGARVGFVRNDSRYAGVDSGDTDIAVVRGTWRTTGLQKAFLFRERRVLAVHKDSELGIRRQVRWAEVAGQPLVVNAENGTTGSNDWPQGQRPAVVERCRNFDEWLEAVAAGRGVGVTTMSVPRRVRHPLVRFVPLDAAPKVPVYLVYPRHGAHPLVSRFVRAAAHAVSQIRDRSAATPVGNRARRDSSHQIVKRRPLT